MPIVQRKYVPTVSLTDRNKSTKRAWSAADFAIAAYAASETGQIADVYGRIEPTVIQFENPGRFARQIDELSSIVIRNAVPVTYASCFSTSGESMEVAGDLSGISAILLSRFQQLPPSSWARVNARWLTWCGVGQPSRDVSCTKLKVAAPLDSTIQIQPLPVPAVVKRAIGEVIDWDARIETPPSRPSWTVKVRFVRGATAKPRLRDDPYA